jgi:MoxR-like ATPase
MPSDITGTEILEEDAVTRKRTFRFIHGPIFGNVILADEINRTPPKTQAALLQAMQEKKVTAGGQTYGLDLPFFVLATQNPIEQEGTYPLPEAQLDRFMFNVQVDYPTEEEEIRIVESTTSPSSQTVQTVLHANDILSTQELVRTVPVDSHVLKYAIRLVRATRDELHRAGEAIRVVWRRPACGTEPNSRPRRRATPESSDA